MTAFIVAFILSVPPVFVLFIIIYLLVPSTQPTAIIPTTINSANPVSPINILYVYGNILFNINLIYI